MTAADWRGQAGSGRLGEDATTGHVEDFQVWLDDLAAFWRDWQASTPGPHVLAAHSMGGHIVLRALVERGIVQEVDGSFAVVPDQAVLASYYARSIEHLF